MAVACRHGRMDDVEGRRGSRREDEKCKGRHARPPGMEFGEAVLRKRRREGGPLGKPSCVWDDGIFLGVKGTTGEKIVGDKKGVW